MSKRKIRLNESQLYNVIARCVSRILGEAYGDENSEKVQPDKGMVSKARRDIMSVIKKTNMRNYTFGKIYGVLKNEMNGIGQGGSDALLTYEQQEPFYLMREVMGKYSHEVFLQAMDKVKKEYYCL